MCHEYSTPARYHWWRRLKVIEVVKYCESHAHRKRLSSAVSAPFSTIISPSPDTHSVSVPGQYSCQLLLCHIGQSSDPCFSVVSIPLMSISCPCQRIIRTSSCHNTFRSWKGPRIWYTRGQSRRSQIVTAPRFPDLLCRSMDEYSWFLVAMQPHVMLKQAAETLHWDISKSKSSSQQP